MIAFTGFCVHRYSIGFYQSSFVADNYIAPGPDHVLVATLLNVVGGHLDGPLFCGRAGFPLGRRRGRQDFAYE